MSQSSIDSQSTSTKPLSELSSFASIGRDRLQKALAEAQASLLRRENQTRYLQFYPDQGPLSRDKYPKHLAFFEAGTKHQERALIAGNRTGKTTCAAYEFAMHLTGLYPDWWPGRRFNGSVLAWVAGEDAKTVRETSQEALLGRPGELGQGMIPKSAIIACTARAGVPDAIDSVTVRHLSGQISRFVFKSYDQGREAFQGAQIQVGWCDEEPPRAVYTEMLTRTMATKPGERSGLMMATFTPLKGLSDVALMFLPGGRMPNA